MKDNETISDIRRIRREIAEQFDFEPKRLIEFYKERQKTRVANQLIRRDDHHKAR